jgi:hypothetical protein
MEKLSKDLEVWVPGDPVSIKLEGMIGAWLNTYHPSRVKNLSQ